MTTTNPSREHNETFQAVITTPARGPAMLVMALPPDVEALTIEAACAANLGRDLLATRVAGLDDPSLRVRRRAVGEVAAAAHIAGAAVLVVPPSLPSATVRLLAIVAGVPVLVARTGGPWRQVLGTTDLIAAGAPVVAAAVALADANRSELGLLHNLAPRWGMPDLGAVAPLSAQRAARRVRKLSRLAARIAPRAAVSVSHAPTPARAILDAIVTRVVDLAIIGARRPGRQRGAGCAERVIDEAASNVLVVPLPRRRATLTGAGDGSRS